MFVKYVMKLLEMLNYYVKNMWSNMSWVLSKQKKKTLNKVRLGHARLIDRQKLLHVTRSGWYAPRLNIYTWSLWLAETTVRIITRFRSRSWYLWWGDGCDRKSLSSFSLQLKWKPDREEKRVAGHSSSHHLSTTHAWLKGLCKLGGLHHLYRAPFKNPEASSSYG